MLLQLVGFDMDFVLLNQRVVFETVNLYE